MIKTKQLFLLVLIGILSISDLPIHSIAETTVHSMNTVAEVPMKGISGVETKDREVIYWAVADGWIYLDTATKSLLHIVDDGKTYKLYNGSIDQLWQNEGRLYVYDGSLGKGFEIDAVTLRLKEVANLKVNTQEGPFDENALRPLVQAPVKAYVIVDQEVYYLLKEDANTLYVAGLSGNSLIRLNLPMSVEKLYVQQGSVLLLTLTGEAYVVSSEQLHQSGTQTEPVAVKVVPKANQVELVEPQPVIALPLPPETSKETTSPGTKPTGTKPAGTTGTIVKPSKPTPSTSGQTQLVPPLNKDLIYTEIPGVLTFRSGQLRHNSAYGTATIKTGALTFSWSQRLPALSKMWGGGAGWTGQPLLVQWPKRFKTFMNIEKRYKENDKFVEVIQASLNGNVYFFDLATGNPTRPPIVIGNPIKGTPSVDSRGIPLLYVGDGIDLNKKPGFRIFNLVNQKQLYYQPGLDPAAPRGWPGMDSSALFLKDKDQMVVASENGMLYQLTLNTRFDEKTGKLTIAPVKKYFNSYMGKGIRGHKEGTENSIARYKNFYYYSDNSGILRCVSSDMKLVWSLNNFDDTDASTALELENGKPVLYTASEVDNQGALGKSRILKVDGTTGKIIWQKNYECHSRFGESPSNGGALASPLVGTGDISNLVIFTLSRCEKFDQGSILAFDKKTGKVAWRKDMGTYAWPSPVAIYDEKGKSYILQNDHNGTVHLLEGKTGKEIWSKKVDSYLEATPAVFNNKVVFSSRTGRIYCFTIY